MPNRKKFKQNDNNLAVAYYRYSSHYRLLSRVLLGFAHVLLCENASHQGRLIN